jgi:hypothetical protein
MQLVPSLHVGGVERGVLEVDAALSCAGIESYVASAGGPLVSGLTGQHMQSLLLSRRDPVCVLLINPLLIALWSRRHKISILHARSRCLVASALLACLITPGTRLVATWHGFYSSSSLPRWMFNSLLLLTDRLIVPSSFIWSHVHAQYPHAAPSHWRLVHRGVAPLDSGALDAEASDHEFHALPTLPHALGDSESHQAPDEVAVALLPGRLAKSKGQDLFLAALRMLRWVFGLLSGCTRKESCVSPPLCCHGSCWACAQFLTRALHGGMATCCGLPPTSHCWCPLLTPILKSSARPPYGSLPLLSDGKRIVVAGRMLGATGAGGRYRTAIRSTMDTLLKEGTREMEVSLEPHTTSMVQVWIP